MKYVDGLHHLDQLKDYVQTSLSIVQKVEQSEHVEQMGDPLSMNEKVEKMEADEESNEFDLLDIVKSEIDDEGEKYIHI